MLLVVGLGNPGEDYAGNRHNIGFMAADSIVNRHELGPFRSKFQGKIAEGSINGVKTAVLKPMTYMNESGRSLAEACRFYKIGPEDIIVLHDEIDLEAGRLRLKDGGGHAGHNGLRSIHDHLGPNYKRLRMGVGHPGTKDHVVRHVLKDFAKADKAWLDPLLNAVAEHFGLLATGDNAGFLNKVSLAVRPPKPKKKPKETMEGENGDGL